MSEQPSMNGKSYEGLTLDGMAAHIGNAILLMNRKIGTRNDCKLTVAHLLRQYQNRLSLSTPEDIPYTPAALNAEQLGHLVELEHAIPVGCLLNVLFHYADGGTHEEVTAQAKNLIEANTILAWVTPEEHRLLNKKHQSSFPAGFDTYPWRDVWARYVASGVSIPGESSSPESLPSYLLRRPGNI